MSDSTQHSHAAAIRSGHRPGMTLIEVLVAMVILGTLLATAVTARGRYIAQAARASKKQKAVTAADVLLTRWSLDWASQNSDDSGTLTGGLLWRRQILERPDTHALDAKVLRLEIWETSPGLGTALGGMTPLTAVEVLIPLELETPKPSPNPQQNESRVLP